MSQRAKIKVRAAIRRQEKHRISIHKTPRHFYALVCDHNGVVLGGISTLTPSIKEGLKVTGGKEAAAKLGAHMPGLLEKLSLKDTAFAFDRSGNIFHGRVEAFVLAMREAGVNV